jgi:hypothetical protein
MMKPLAQSLVVLAFTVATSCSQYATVTAKKLRFLETQERPLLLPEVTKRLGNTEIGRGPYYAYTTAEKRTVEFWMLPPPETTTEKTVPVEIAMVVERSPGGKSLIIWPRDLRGSSVDSAMKRFWPKMY